MPVTRHTDLARAAAGLSACALLLLLLPLTVAIPAAAQVTWENGRPIFHSRPRQAPSYAPQYRPRPSYRSYSYGRYYPFQAYPDYRDDDDYYERRRQRSAAPDVASGGPRPDIAPETPPTVRFPYDESPGTVVIDTATRRLYLVQEDGTALLYPISVGREGFDWTGSEVVSRVADWPDWHPPEDMRDRQPDLPKKMTGGLRNPLGAKAIYLGNTLYRIHGTNDPKSIGRASSSGCFRMLNAHVAHLAGLIDVGTTVKVVDHLPPPLPGTATGHRSDTTPRITPGPGNRSDAPS